MVLELPIISEVGVDECGRGPLLGDCVAAAVMLPDNLDTSVCKEWEEIKDSKKVSKKKRERLATFIKEHASAWGIGVATVAEIDSVNILQATYLAMHRALGAVWEKQHFERIMVDGDKFRPWLPPGGGEWPLYRCLPNADATHLHVAAASIIAKVHHDNAIEKLVEEHPELKAYGIQTNMGYGTAAHMDALSKLGPTQWHRTSFAPVARALAKQKE